ncbi:MAG: hypothetical protein ACRDYX_20875 [Egibacteraceae bacterium]
MGHRHDERTACPATDYGSRQAVCALVERLANRLEATATRLADWAHGRCCVTCRHEHALENRSSA